MADEDDEPQMEGYRNDIADPVLDGDALKRSKKLITKSLEVKKALKRGIGEVTKAIRKKQPGICYLAADVYPVDIISHLPCLCEDHNVLYGFIPSRTELGKAAGSKRPASALFVSKPDTEEAYESLYKKVSKLLKPLQPTAK
uniref:Ribosomal protein eL8/eL30/eS12/Gadd45 domain-containing protein n=1 Tax=Chromera velia CCMP2878 TaxID=1169474 RepID=A0A0G4I2E5_9ALVE|mmetsp:Transcript_20578/g.41129  ORF Transcript_20578/g.41129 Transcript_20578/m.41129 type:complete len:142 (+) Transcript_20578:166-591(+)|eukprot:Cvel_35073.t1-p1 / transcript=Cvel_35073.t1 / gene=Cvel_35073 / organism=Chromera_velia_CCMP2878 / gene_product=Putative H/ACA ribonucleoprotein complex subunit, putative / transcript_product=Putative H/ACA ribonucleoprotein complex subunit, putative / location=Cvel_scaffold6265:704-1126(+) / protein_length=141 / sequence_SO=supercontig / SO=protein_coding / is_pseudo=false